MEAVTFSSNDADRIEAAVLAYERENASSNHASTSFQSGNRPWFMAELTGCDSSNPWRYSWRAVRMKRTATGSTLSVGGLYEPVIPTIEGTYNNNYAFHENGIAWLPAGTIVRLSLAKEGSVTRRLFSFSAPSGGETYLGRVVNYGPSNASDFSDERYWILEQLLIDVDNGKLCLADKFGGFHLAATNIMELGTEDNRGSGSGQASAPGDSHACSGSTLLMSGSGSSVSTQYGKQMDGFHGILKKPARAGGERFVLVRTMITFTRKLAYIIETIPAPAISRTYHFDSTCLDSNGCPDGVWLKGYMFFAVTDSDAGDDMPHC